MNTKFLMNTIVFNLEDLIFGPEVNFRDFKMISGQG